STAIRITGLRSRGAERLDVAAAIGVTGRADPVRALRPAALRADVQARRFDLVLRPALVATRLRGLLLGAGHERRSVAARSACPRKGPGNREVPPGRAGTLDPWRGA